MTERSYLEAALEPELAERLQQIYRLARRPDTLGALRELFGEGRREPQFEHYLERIRSGAGVIGAARGATPYANVLAEGEVGVMCGYDALMNALLRGGGTVRGSCVHCGEALELELAGEEIVRRSSAGMVFWFGTGPLGAPGNPVCDHLHLFPDRTHLDAWLVSQPHELGVAMAIGDAVAFFAGHPIPPAFVRSGSADRSG